MNELNGPNQKCEVHLAHLKTIEEFWLLSQDLLGYNKFCAFPPSVRNLSLVSHEFQILISEMLAQMIPTSSKGTSLVCLVGLGVLMSWVFVFVVFVMLGHNNPSIVNLCTFNGYQDFYSLS